MGRAARAPVGSAAAVPATAPAGRLVTRFPNLPTTAQVAAGRTGALTKPLSPKRVKKARQRAAKTARKSVYDKVDERDGCRCRRCRIPLPVGLLGRHHIKFRSQGGKDETGNLCDICPKCHDLIHGRRVVVVGDADGVLWFMPGPLGTKIVAIKSLPLFPLAEAAHG